MRKLIAAIAVPCLVAMGLAEPAAARDWYVAETTNFIIKSEDDEETVREFAMELERFDMALRTLQNMPLGEELESDSLKLTVYRFGDESDVRRVVQVPSAAAVFFPRAGNNNAYTPSREERSRSMSVTRPGRRQAELAKLDVVSALRHEYVHYFMMQNFPAAYPLWYLEGYAEMMASIRFNGDGSFHVGDPPQYRAYNIFRMSQFPLEEMLDTKHQLSGRDAFQHYGTGWLLTHYLNFNRYDDLNTYLGAIAAGEDSLQAGRRIFGDLDELDGVLRSYRNGPFPGIQVPTSNFIEPVVNIRPMTDAEVAVIDSEMRLNRYARSEEEARDIAADLRTALSGMPDDLHALALLARAEIGAENYTAALEVGERMLAIDPDNRDANLVMAESANEMIEDDPAMAEPSRSHAAAALDADMLDPRPRIAYYASFVEAHETPPEQAIIALEDAYETAGTDFAYRVYLTRQLVLENRLDSARNVLMPVAFRGHGQEDEDEEEKTDDDDPSLDEVLRHLIAGDRDAALAELDEIVYYEEDED